MGLEKYSINKSDGYTNIEVIAAESIKMRYSLTPLIPVDEEKDRIIEEYFSSKPIKGIVIFKRDSKE